MIDHKTLKDHIRSIDTPLSLDCQEDVQDIVYVLKWLGFSYNIEIIVDTAEKYRYSRKKKATLVWQAMGEI